MNSQNNLTPRFKSGGNKTDKKNRPTNQKIANGNTGRFKTLECIPVGSLVKTHHMTEV
jgi:hypothetical protein